MSRGAADGGLAYRPEIDGLRAIAVGLVVLYHAAAMPRSGFVGVDVFFVISGYLITLLLLRESQAHGSIDLVAFYARRVRRIFPAALFVIAVTLLLADQLLGPAPLRAVAHSAIASALFTGNVYFQFATGGYWDASADEQPLLHLWSLAVEEQFYLVWPALLILLLRRGRSPTPALAALAAASLLLCELLLQWNAQAAFFQMPARFWELAAGGLVAASRPTRQPAAGTTALGLVLVLAGACVPLVHFPGMGAMPAVAGTALLLRAVHAGGNGGVLACLRLTPLVGLGRISYSLYLWHWPLLAFYGATTLGAQSTSTRLLLSAAAIPLAWLSYRYVEQPLRHRAPTRRLLAACMVVSTVLAGAALVVLLRQPTPASDPREQWASYVEADLPLDWRRCHYQVGSTDFPRPDCASDSARRPTIAIWGDSMAMSWKPLAWQLAAETGASAIAYTRDACPPLLGDLATPTTPAAEKCRDFNAAVAQQLPGLQTLILVMRLDAGDDAKIAKLSPTLDALSGRVARVLLFGPSPHLPESVGRCIRSGDLDACRLPRAEFDRMAAPLLAQLHALAARYPNVDVVDTGGFFCDAQFCPGVRAGEALYWDTHHITASASRAFARQYLRHEQAPPPAR